MFTLKSKIAIVMLAGLLTADVAAAQDKKVMIATEGAYPPWNATSPSGKLYGFDVDLAEEVCKRMKLTCEIVAQDWDGIIPALNAGKFDAIMAAMSITEERREAIEFTRPYGGMPAVFGTLKESDLVSVLPFESAFSLNSPSDDAAAAIANLNETLKGKVVGVQGSTTFANFLDTLMSDAVEVREYKTAEQVLFDLQAGRIDVAMNSMSYWNPLMEKPEGADIALIGPRLTGGPFGPGVGVGIRKSDSELLKMMDEAIASAAADGTIKALSEKWFKMDITPLY